MSRPWSWPYAAKSGQTIIPLKDDEEDPAAAGREAEVLAMLREAISGHEGE